MLYANHYLSKISRESRESASEARISATAAEGDDNIPIENERLGLEGTGTTIRVNPFVTQPLMINIENLKGKYSTKAMGFTNMNQIKRKPGYAPVETQPNEMPPRKNLVGNSRNSARSVYSAKPG